MPSSSAPCISNTSTCSQRPKQNPSQLLYLPQVLHPYSWSWHSISAVFIIRSAGYCWMGVHVLLHVRLLPVCISNWSQRSAPPPAHCAPLIFPFLGSLNNYFVARERRLLWGLALPVAEHLQFCIFSYWTEQSVTLLLYWEDEKVGMRMERCF